MAEETRIFVKCPSRKKRYKLVFQSQPNKISGEKIKRHLVGPTATPVENQRLYFNGKEVENDENGDKLGILNDSVITLEIEDGSQPPASPPARTQSPPQAPVSPRYERPPLPPSRAASAERPVHPMDRTASPDRPQSPVITLSHCRVSVVKATGLHEAGVSGPIAVGLRGGAGPWVYTGEAISDHSVKFDEQLTVTDSTGNAARLKVVVRKAEGAIAFGTFNLQQTNGDVFQSVVNMYADRKKTQPLPLRVVISYNTNASKSSTPLPETTTRITAPPMSNIPSPMAMPTPISPPSSQPTFPTSAFSMPAMRFDSASTPPSIASKTAELLIERVYGLVNLQPSTFIYVSLRNAASVVSTPPKSAMQIEWNEATYLPLQVITDEVLIECIIYKGDGSELARGAASLNLRFPNAVVNMNCFIADGVGNYYPNGVIVLRYRGCTPVPALPGSTPPGYATFQPSLPHRPPDSTPLSTPYIHTTPSFARPPSPPAAAFAPSFTLPRDSVVLGSIPRPASPLRPTLASTQPLVSGINGDGAGFFNGYINVKIHRITSIEGTMLSEIIFPGSIYIGVRNIGDQWRYSTAKLASTIEWGDEVKIPVYERGTLEISIMQAGSDVCMAQGTFQMQGSDSNSVTAALLFGPNASSGLWDLPRALVQLTYRTFSGPIREHPPSFPLPSASPSIGRVPQSPMKPSQQLPDDADIDFASKIEQERLELVKKLQSLNEKTQSHINHISQNRDITLLKLKQYEEQLERLHLDNEQVHTDITDIEKRFAERRYTSPYRPTSPSLSKSPLRLLETTSPRHLTAAVHQLLEEREILSTENEILRTEHQKLMSDVDREMEFHRERLNRAQNIELQLEKSKVQFLEQLLQMQQRSSTFPLPTPPMPFMQDTSLRMG